MKANTVKKLLAVAMAAAGLAAFAAPAVTVNSVTENGTWSTIDVTYTLSGVDTSANYKMQFDVTVDGVTKTVTDDSFATKSNTSYTKTIDTKTLFGSACRDAKAKVKVSLIDDQPDVSGGQLWENGPIWAACNVGAENPWDYGYYFWWGDTVGYKRSGGKWVSSEDGTTTIDFRSSSKIKTKEQKTTWLTDNGWIDGNGNLVAEHDAARAHLKGDWRMPTSAELQALVANCTKKRATLNGIEGFIFTGKGEYASKGVFLPAAGSGRGSDTYYIGKNSCYWSSTVYYSGSSYAYAATADTASFDGGNHGYRYYGFTIRPVR